MIYIKMHINGADIHYATTSIKKIYKDYCDFVNNPFKFKDFLNSMRLNTSNIFNENGDVLPSVIENSDEPIFYFLALTDKR